jgi:hypothetical protein
MLTPGIHLNVPSAVYHKRELGIVSKSAMDQFRRSPEHYRAWVAGIEPEPTPALVFGNAVDCALLEPDVFAAKYAIAPEFGNCSHKEPKAKRDAWRAQNPGKTWLDSDDGERLQAMVTRARGDKILAQLLADPKGSSQVTLCWKDKATGLLCKGRVDWLAPSFGVAVDLKTTMDASAGEFRRSVANYGYHRQNAMYADGLRELGFELRKFTFAAVEKEIPFGFAMYWLREDDIARGHEQNARDMAGLAECLRNDEWPGYSGGELELPAWAA